MKLTVAALLTLITCTYPGLFVHNVYAMGIDSAKSQKALSYFQPPLPHFQTKYCCVCLEDIVGMDGIAIACPLGTSHSSGMCAGCFKKLRDKYVFGNKYGYCCQICNSSLRDHAYFYPNLNAQIDREIESFKKYNYVTLACSSCKKNYTDKTLRSTPIVHLGCQGYNHFVCGGCTDKVPKSFLDGSDRCPDCFQSINPVKLQGHRYLNDAEKIALHLYRRASHRLALTIIHEGNVTHTQEIAHETVCRLCNGETPAANFILLGCGNNHKICVTCMLIYWQINTTCTLCAHDGKPLHYTIGATEKYRIEEEIVKEIVRIEKTGVSPAPSDMLSAVASSYFWRLVYQQERHNVLKYMAKIYSWELTLDDLPPLERTLASEK